MIDSHPDVRLLLFSDDAYPPCRTLAASLRAIVGDDPGVAMVHVDAWQRPDMVIEHRVITVPTVILIVDGREALRLAGPRSERALRRQLSRRVPWLAAPRRQRRLQPVGAEMS